MKDNKKDGIIDFNSFSDGREVNFSGKIKMITNYTEVLERKRDRDKYFEELGRLIDDSRNEFVTIDTIGELLYLDENITEETKPKFIKKERFYENTIPKNKRTKKFDLIHHVYGQSQKNI